MVANRARHQPTTLSPVPSRVIIRQLCRTRNETRDNPAIRFPPANAFMNLGHEGHGCDHGS